MSQKTDPEPRDAAKPKPQLSLLIATCFGLGYLPKAPGTWGSLAGVILYWGFCRLLWMRPLSGLCFQFGVNGPAFSLRLPAELAFCIALAFLGIWVAGRVAKHTNTRDPQFVVIDEVSGQHFTYVLGLAPVSWKYLLLGFILFRVFDIWKPFPARQAEHLPGGWGIMADDWVAAIYAALGLWLARALGL